MKTTIFELPITRTVYEYEMLVEDQGHRYVANYEITMPRRTLDGNKVDYRENVEKQFIKLIKDKKITPTDRLKFVFNTDGTYVINQRKKCRGEFKGRVSKYAGERLHIEIPKSFRGLFEEGEQITFIKNNLEE